MLTLQGFVVFFGGFQVYNLPTITLHLVSWSVQIRAVDVLMSLVLLFRRGLRGTRRR